MTQDLQPHERIRARSEFQRVYDRGCRIHGRYMTLLVLPTQRSAPRLGVAATKKLGGAVWRNRAKRIVREIFRRNKISAGVDVVVVPRREMFKVSFAALEADFRAAAGRRPRGAHAS